MDLDVESPGRSMNETFKTIMLPNNFVNILDERYSAWLQGVDWDLYADLTKPYDHPTKREGFHKVMDVFRRASRNDSHAQTPEFIAFHDKLVKVNESLKYIHIQRTEAYCKAYFNRMYPQADIEIMPKLSGVQTGCIVSINTSLLFYVKTHSEGSSRSHSTAPKPMNPGEILVYKILELLHISSDVHVFGKDIRNFYIATKDAGAGGSFRTFDTLCMDRNQLGDLVGSSFLSACIGAAPHSETEEILLRNDASIAFSRCVFHLEIFSGLFHLTDLLTNAGNFGILYRTTSQFQRLRVVDFRLKQNCEAILLDSNQIQGLIDGNSPYLYAACDGIIQYCCCHRPIHTRRLEARHLASEVDLVHVLEAARTWVDGQLEFLHNDVLKLSLDVYCNTLRRNWEIFQRVARSG